MLYKDTTYPVWLVCLLLIPVAIVCVPLAPLVVYFGLFDWLLEDIKK